MTARAPTVTGHVREECADRDQERSREARWQVAEVGAANEEEELLRACVSDEQHGLHTKQDVAKHGVAKVPSSSWVVLVDGVPHGCEIPNDELPRPGTSLVVDGNRVRVDYIATSEDGRPLINATTAA
jgi:hypothetical protein